MTLKAIETIKWQFSNVDRWWNYGDEFKPNKTEFDQITWNNFNDSFLSASSFFWNGGLTATAHVAEYLLNRIFRVNVENKQKNPKSYFFYVDSKIETWRPSEKGTVYKVQLHVDVWLTYILQPEINIEAWSNRFHHKWPGLSSVLQYNLNNDNNLFDTANARIQKINFFPNREVPLISRNQNYNGSNVIFNQKLKYFNTIKYYVFKEKKEPGFIGGDNNVILIPVLLDSASYFQKNNLEGLARVNFAFLMDGVGPDRVKLFLMNDEQRLLNLVDRRLSYKAGLGDFVGVFIGPNIFRVSGLINYRVNVDGFGDLNISNIVPITAFRVGGRAEVMGFYCFRIGSNPAHITVVDKYGEMDNIVNAVKSGLYPLGDPDGWLTTFAENLTFTDKLVYLHKTGIFSRTTELPVYTDSYFAWLAQTKPNRDNAINVANQQLGMGIVNNLGSAVFGGATSLLSGSVTGLMKTGFNLVGNMINTGLQYSNKLKQIEVEKESKRLATSTEITSSDVSFFPNYLQLQEEMQLDNSVIVFPEVTTTNLQSRCYELFVGTKKTNLIDLYNFTGFKTDWYQLGKKVWEVDRGYIILPESIRHSWIFKDYLNDEREAVVKLLSQGIRVGYKSEVENDFN